MTVSSDPFRNDYIGTGSVDTYSYGFRIFNESDLLVTQVDTSGIETTLVLNTDYTVTGVGAFSGGTIVLTGDLASGYGLTIRGVFTIEQQTDLRNQGGYKPETVEDALDYLTRLTQQQQDEIGRAIIKPETEAASALTLPTVALRKNKFLSFDTAGDPIAASAVTGAPVTSFMETVLDDTTAAAVRTTLDAAALATANTFTANQTVEGTINHAAASGTDTYTATLGFTALVTGMPVSVYFANANTSTTPSFNPDTLGADTMVDQAGAALEIGAVNGYHTLRHDGTNWRVLNPVITNTDIFVPKTALEEVSLSSTLQDDDHLFATLEASTHYKFSFSITAIAASATPDLKMQFIEPDGSFDFVISHYTTGTGAVTDVVINQSTAASVIALGVTTDEIINVTGNISTGGTGGTFKLQWAQNTTSADAVQVQTGGYMKFEKIT